MLLMSEVKLLSQVQSIVPFHSVEHSAAFLHHMEDMIMTTRSEGAVVDEVANLQVLKGCARCSAECNVTAHERGILSPLELWWTRLPD